MKSLILTDLVSVLILSPMVLAGEPDLLIADFERADHGGWIAEGAAFGTGPARGTLPGQMTVDGFEGQGLVNSFLGGDDATGTLTSPSFALQRRYLRFLIGGGAYEGETCLNLLVSNAVVRAATGPNTQPGGSERLEWAQWDVQNLAGQQARLQVVDRRKGGWGHINVDHIFQTDQRLPGLVTNATRELAIQGRYLNLPVKNGAPKRLVTLRIDQGPVRQFEIELAETTPDWWAFADISAYGGRSAVLQVDRLPENSAGLAQVELADQIRGEADLYHETFRPQFHFTARRGWNNDPNGLVYYDGEYHLFFQHNPYGWNWGNMHWGHAVSRDLVHWQELPIALYPDALGTMFSGSAVVDEANTGGFPPGPHPPMVCVYTAAGGTSAESKGQPFTQCLAFSTDRGRTWTSHAGNPVLPHIIGGNRDPKVFWYAPGKKWIMALYLDQSDFALFSSPDLKQWKRLSEVTIPATSECPEFFPIAVDGSIGERRWVFYGGNGRYLVGRFDGTAFTMESGPHTLNYGDAFYASQTYNHIPESDGRRILVPWGTVATPGMPFNQMIGLPVSLTLRQTGDGLRLFAWPVRELEGLRTTTQQWPAQALAPGQNPLAEVRGELFDIEAELLVGEAAELRLDLRGTEVLYNVARQELKCRAKTAPLKPVDGRIRLRILVDRTSLDIFGNAGGCYMPMGALAEPGNQGLVLESRGGAARLERLQVWGLEPAR